MWLPWNWSDWLLWRSTAMHTLGKWLAFKQWIFRSLGKTSMASINCHHIFNFIPAAQVSDFLTYTLLAPTSRQFQSRLVGKAASTLATMAWLWRLSPPFGSLPRFPAGIFLEECSGAMRSRTWCENHTFLDGTIGLAPQQEHTRFLNHYGTYDQDGLWNIQEWGVVVWSRHPFFVCWCNVFSWDKSCPNSYSPAAILGTDLPRSLGLV